MRSKWSATIVVAASVLVLMAVYFANDNEVYLSPPVPMDIDQEKVIEVTSSPAVEIPEEETAFDQSLDSEEEVVPDDLYELYAPFIPLHFKQVTLKASIADTPLERQQGLSGTPRIPSDVAKLFVFETDDRWGFWMKDMNYSIDMIWLDSDYQVIHIVHRATPDSYPALFTPPVAARYVIETEQGFAQRYGISLGETVTIDWQN